MPSSPSFEYGQESTGHKGRNGTQTNGLLVRIGAEFLLVPQRHKLDLLCLDTAPRPHMGNEPLWVSFNHGC